MRTSLAREFARRQRFTADDAPPAEAEAVVIPRPIPAELVVGAAGNTNTMPQWGQATGCPANEASLATGCRHEGQGVAPAVEPEALVAAHTRFLEKATAGAEEGAVTTPT
jgi:hypothetical protein